MTRFLSVSYNRIMETFAKHFTKRNLLFILIFVLVGFAVLQIPVAQLAGSKAKFTVYDAFAPVAGAFIGTVPGVIAVFLVNFLNFLAKGAVVQDIGTIIRFFPILFAVLYFARKAFLNVIVPALAIAVFLAHPIGREVWYFALFWTIPILAHFFYDRSLLARALGATFSAHAVGSSLWIWAFNLPAPVWQGLIPVVIGERLLFAAGIAVSFLAVNNLLAFLEKRLNVRLGFLVQQKYLIPQLRA